MKTPQSSHPNEQDRYEIVELTGMLRWGVRAVGHAVPLMAFGLQSQAQIEVEKLNAAKVPLCAFCYQPMFAGEEDEKRPTMHEGCAELDEQIQYGDAEVDRRIDQAIAAKHGVEL